MTNQVNQDAEESATIEKTASEPNEQLTASAPAAAPETLHTTESVATTASAQTAIETSFAPVETEAPSTDVADPEITVQNVEEPQSPQESQPAHEPVEESQAAQETSPQQKTSRVVAAPPQNAPAEDGQASGEIDFGAILEQFEQEQTVFHSGELVTGTIVGITDRGVLIDFGYKSEGFVPPEEFTGPEGEMTAVVGETVEVVIRSIHSGEGAPQLSRHDALGRKVWDEIEAAFQAETPVIGRVVDKTKGGLRIDLNGIEAFLPGSQIDSRPIRGLDSYIGQDIEAKIIKFSRRRNNIVLSRKVITDELVNEQKAETLTKIDVGFIVDGVIKNLTEYGAFVDIGGIDGLLHVTDMSWGRIHHPGDRFNVGDHIQVKVLKLDREKEKVSLGYKQLLPDPWSTVVEVYPVNTKLNGIVSSVTEYGVFVELESGVEGLVHVSEISWSRRSQSPKRLFHKGQEVEVQVLGVDTVEKRISLGMKQFQDNPWDFVDIKYPVGAKVRGRVRNLTDFGAFVELEEGIDGLVHVSDISWAKKIKHPKDVLRKDQEVEAIVTSIDKRGQRLSLSMKDLTPSAWEGFVATHRPGDVVKGKVSRFTNFGVFVELGEGLEGLCHISELSDERIDRAESVAELGQEMDFKILRIEPVEQKIGLSHRAIGKEDEPVVDTKMYSTEAKGGMASLGELAKLRFGDATEESDPKQDAEEKKKEKKAAKQLRAEEFAAKEAEAAAAPAAEEENVVETEDSSETPAETNAETDPIADEAPALESTEASSPETVEPETAVTDEEPTEVKTSEPETLPDESPAEETSVTEVSEKVPSAETPTNDAGPVETAAADSPDNETAAADEVPSEEPSAASLIEEGKTEEVPEAETAAVEAAVPKTAEAETPEMADVDEAVPAGKSTVDSPDEEDAEKQPA
jgi:small subunit ribosomal protein S1